MFSQNGTSPMIESEAIFTSQSMPMGLSEAEAQRILVQRGPIKGAPSSRSYTSIVLANVFTVFNLVLIILGIGALTFGDPRDALFLAVLVSNSIIGLRRKFEQNEPSTDWQRSLLRQGTSFAMVTCEKSSFKRSWWVI